jgi:ferric-dicitrate binding protein FerR (iron transport regulator)
MSGCERIEDYLDGWLTPEEAAAFEAHLAGCASCREAKARWEAVAGRIAKAAETAPGREADAGRLVALAGAGARPGSGRSAGRELWIGLALAASVAVVSAAALWLAAGPEDMVEAPAAGVAAPVPLPLAYEIATPAGVSTAEIRNPAGARLTAPADGRLMAAIGGDRLGLAAGGALRVLQADRGALRLVLERGELACAVASRAAGGEFTVEAAGREIRVRGTRFSVALGEGEAVAVTVAEGVVEVGTGEGVPQRVAAGRRLAVSVSGAAREEEVGDEGDRRIAALLGELPVLDAGLAAAVEDPGGAKDAGAGSRAVPTGVAGRKIPRDEAAPEEDAWDAAGARHLVAGGRHAEAERSLAGRLAAVPGDAEAWMLLADCQRNQGRWQAAVDAYERVALLGRDASKANRARFLAGSVLQDRLGRHAEAAGLFEEHLANGGGGLRAEAMLRLAVSLRETGAGARARALLDEIVRNHPGTPSALRAEGLLRQTEETP